MNKDKISPLLRKEGPGVVGIFIQGSDPAVKVLIRTKPPLNPLLEKEGTFGLQLLKN